MPVLLAALVAPVPAAAQLAGSVTLQSDYRLRGYSVSEGQPAAILALSYDHANGVYLNGSLIGSLDDDDNPALLGWVGNIGYARHVATRVSIDAGVTRSEYQRGGGAGPYLDYTEIYAGVLAGGVSAHLYYSPDYFRRGASTLYGEIEAGIEPVPKLRLSAHLGLLGYVATPAGMAEREVEYDWRLTASRRFGAIDVHASVSDGGPDEDYYHRRPHGKAALTVGATWTF